MNDEIKEAAEKWWCETGYTLTAYSDISTEDIDNAFIAGNNYATEKCQEEIKRLKTQLGCRYNHFSIMGDFHCNKCGFTRIEKGVSK